jgi:hypothetical protein
MGKGIEPRAGSEPDLARMRAKTSSFPDVSGAQYQVLHQDARGDITRTTGEVVSRPSGGGASAVGVWTAAFAAMTTLFAWLVHAPTAITGGGIAIAVVGLVIAFWPRRGSAGAGGTDAANPASTVRKG